MVPLFHFYSNPLHMISGQPVKHDSKRQIIITASYKIKPFSSSVGPIANAMDVLQPIGLIVLTLSPPPVWTFQRSPPGTSHVPNDARDPSSERWNCVGEN